MTKDLFSIQGKTYLLTGAASGLARGLALQLAEHKTHLVLFDINADGLQETKSTIEKAGGSCSTHIVDVREQQQIDAAFAEIKDRPVDVLLNIAGVLLYKPFLETTGDDWDKIFDTNMKGIFLMSQACAKHMIAHKTKGNIINIASACMHRGQVDTIAYSSAKSGLSMFTKNSALEFLPHGIRVNTVAPGWMLTPMVKAILEEGDADKALNDVPMNRAADISELLGPIVFLSTEASSYMTGEVIHFDGGLICNLVRVY